MREDETCRLVETKQTLFILHDQFIGTLVVAALFRFFLRPGIDKVACLFVLREIAIVCLAHRLERQVTHIRFVCKGGLHLLDHTDILLFKHFGKLAIAFAFLAVEAIVLYMVNKEQAQHLNPLRIELSFALDVALDGFAYLHATHRVFGHFAHSIAFM